MASVGPHRPGGSPGAPVIWMGRLFIRFCQWLWHPRNPVVVVIWTIILAPIIDNFVFALLFDTAFAPAIAAAPITSWIAMHQYIVIFALGFAAIVVVVNVVVYFANANASLRQSGIQHIWNIPWKTILIVLLVVGMLASLFIFVPPVIRLLYPTPGIGFIPGYNPAVGLCDGRTCAFASDSINALQVQDALNYHDNLARATSILDLAAQTDPTDAQAKIYENNLKILSDAQDNKQEYYTAVVATSLPGKKTTTDAEKNLVTLDAHIENGNHILQGAYVVQKKYNEEHKGQPQLLLLIANIGTADIPSWNVVQQEVADRIINEAESPRFMA